MKKIVNPIFVFLSSRVFNVRKARQFCVIQPKVLSAAELDTYVGIYTNVDLRMKVTVKKNVEGNSLLAQSADAEAFPLVTINKNTFNHSPSGIEMEFLPENNKFAVIKCGGYFPFIKEA